MSRLPLLQQSDWEEAKEVLRISFVDALPVTVVEIAAETAKDPLLSQVYHYVMEGWPYQGVSEEMRSLYQRKSSCQQIKAASYGAWG